MKKLFVSALVLVIVVSVFTACLSLLTPAKTDYFQRGMAALNAGNFDQAIADFNQAVSLDQNKTKAYIGLAYSYEFKDIGDEVVNALTNAILSMPTVIDALSRHIYVDFRDEFSLIIADFETALQIDISGIKSNLDMSAHFAMQSGARHLMMNEM